MPEITLDQAAQVSKLAQNQLAELRSEVARLRMYEPGARSGAMPVTQQINPTDFIYWGLE